MPKSSGDVMVKDQTKLLHLYCSKKHRNVEKVHQPNKTIKKYSPKLLCWPLSAVAGLHRFLRGSQTHNSIMLWGLDGDTFTVYISLIGIKAEMKK